MDINGICGFCLFFHNAIESDNSQKFNYKAVSRSASSRVALKKISQPYHSEIESEFFLEELNESLCENLFHFEANINQLSSDELFYCQTKSSE